MMHWNGDSWGWVGWLLMALSMLAFWGLIAWVAVTVLRSTGASNSPGSGHPDEILAERFARGEIDEDEYRHRLDVVRKHPDC